MPYFLRHYSGFVDNFYFYDNHSTDNSLKIIQTCPNTHVIQFDTNNEIRDDVFKNIKNECWKEDNSDFVIVCDMDEFLYHPNIKDYLQANIMCSMFNTQGYDMISDHFPTTEGQIYEEVNKGVQNPQYSKKIIFSPELEEINYSEGCHYCYPKGNVFYAPGYQLKLLHFKYLGLDEYVRKTIKLADRLSTFNKENRFGSHHEKTVEEMVRLFNQKLSLAERVL